MIIECPNCETRYELPVDLPPEGRKVRCATCKHIWTATEAAKEKPKIEVPRFEDEEIVFKEDVPEAETSSPPPEPEPPAEAVEEAASAEDTISDEEMEQAFSDAIAEAAQTDADFDVETPQAEEEESPPIVIGKAKKKRAPLPTRLAAGWAGLALFLAGVASFAYFQRVSVVRALPGAAPAYESLGLPVNVRGLEFSGVKYSWETSAGRPVLEVYGNITNITSRPLKVPTVVFGLRTKEKVEVYQWAADVSSEMLPPGKTTPFSAQIPTPPKSIRDVQVRFAKIR